MSHIQLRPQPIGIFPFPVGYLLLPPSNGDCQVLMQGQQLEAYPSEWQFFDSTIYEDLDGAYRLLANDRSAIGKYNQFVLYATPEKYAQLRKEFDSELRTLLDVVAYSIGYIDQPPTTEAVTDELQAFVMMAQATYAIEVGQLDDAMSILEQAILIAEQTSPIFAAQLTSILADTERQAKGVSAKVIQRYKDAIAVLRKTDLQTDLGRLYLDLGAAYQEMAEGQRVILMEAIQWYQYATRILTKHGQPELYALGKNKESEATQSIELMIAEQMV